MLAWKGKFWKSKPALAQTVQHTPFVGCSKAVPLLHGGPKTVHKREEGREGGGLLRLFVGGGAALHQLLRTRMKIGGSSKHKNEYVRKNVS